MGYRCVPYYTCDRCNQIITDGTSLFDPRAGGPEEDCDQSEKCTLLRNMVIMERKV